MNRGPTPAELDALTAWWKAQRHIGRAATLLGRKRQTVANNLMTLRRLEGATDNVELALRHLDDIERNWPNVLRKTSRIVSFAEARVDSWRSSERTGTFDATRHNTKSGESDLIPGRLSAVPSPAVSTWLRNRMPATESRQILAQCIADQDTAEPAQFHVLGFFGGQHGVRDQLVIREHRVVHPPRHCSMIAAGSTS